MLHQGFVGALFDQLSLIEDQDTIGRLGQGQTMADHQGGLGIHKMLDLLNHAVFGVGVQGAGLRWG